MKIKKNIAVWGVLLAFMVALVPPSSAKANTTEATADDVKYLDIESFVHGMGYSDFVANEGSMYLAFLNNSNFAVIEFVGIEGLDFAAYYTPSYKSNVSMVVTGVQSLDGKVFEYIYLSPAEASKNNNFSVRYNAYDYDAENAYYLGKHSYSFELYSWGEEYYNFQYLVYSDFDVYLHEGSSKYFYNEGDLVFECTKEGVFSFPVWCADAGLNCLASSNESSTKIPYSYNSYWHIVRKTSSGKWLLTTVGNSVSQENASDYTFMYSEDMGTLQVLNLYSGEDTNGYLLNVRQYEYDTDGWKVRTYETYDARETDDCIIDLGAGSGVDDTRVLAYTNVNIYDQNFELVTSASTEYVEPTTPESPSEEITPTPTTAPSGGGVGGGTRPEVTPAVSAGQATVVLDRTGIYEEPSTTSQLQHYLYSGALVYVVDELENGWYYVRYEVGGLSQVGYVYSENIDYSSENGYASGIVGGEVVEKVEEMLGMVKVVPVMISVLFSFLPPWCLAVVGVGFSLLIALIIYKCARG